MQARRFELHDAMVLLSRQEANVKVAKPRRKLPVLPGPGPARVDGLPFACFSSSSLRAAIAASSSMATSVLRWKGKMALDGESREMVKKTLSSGALHLAACRKRRYCSPDGRLFFRQLGDLCCQNHSVVAARTDFCISNVLPDPTRNRKTVSVFGTEPLRSAASPSRLRVFPCHEPSATSNPH